MSDEPIVVGSSAHAALLRLRDRLSLLQIAIATATVALGDGIAPWSLALACALTLLAFVRPLPPVPSRAGERLWTLGIAAALVATLARAVLTLEVLDAGIDFLLLLVVQRFFNRQRAREHMQLLLLGSLLLVTGAVINAGINFPLLFAAYLVVAVMTLLLNHLAAEGERLGARTAVSVGKEGMRARGFLWRAAVQVAVIAAVGAAITFIAFPRWGVGFFLRGGIARDRTSGFASTVELGDFGRIKSDTTVVMRIEPVQRTDVEPAPDWHLRGSSFDAYERGRWSHRDDAEATIVAGPYGYRQLLDDRGGNQLQPGFTGLPRAIAIPGFAAATQVLVATVTLEDIGVDVLFAASEPLAVRVAPRGPIESRTEIRAGRSAELRVDKAPGPIRYEFVSRIGTPTTKELIAAGNPDARALAPYLARAQGLSPEFAALAASLAPGAVNRFQKVDAVMKHLAGFRYTLDNRPSDRVLAGADPIEGFLFDTQAGHCEYFATAMALLLRELDVPARIVNGYYGAHYNQVGGYWSVRQADAHSWVEVHFGHLGWVTFDPTPPGGREAADDAAWWPAASELVDAVRNAYLSWIIDYDLGKQLTLFENLGLRNRTGESLVARWRSLLLSLVAVPLLLALAWRLRRWRRRRLAPATAAWLTIERRLARRGFVIGGHESLPHFATRVAGTDAALGDALTAFARHYEQSRFGPPSEPGAIEAVRTAARRVLEVLRR